MGTRDTIACQTNSNMMLLQTDNEKPVDDGLFWKPLANTNEYSSASGAYIIS
jgi:hypothetical protein